MQSKGKLIIKNDGSLTIETTLIISAIILILVTLVFSFMLMYQKALLAKTAGKAAQQGAEIWVDSRKQIESGSIDTDKERDSIYYRILDDSFLNCKKYSITVKSLSELKAALSHEGEIQSKQNEKLFKINDLIVRELNRGILKPSMTKLDIEYSNKIVRKLEVKLTQTIKLPAGFLFRFFGNKGSMDLISCGTAYVSEPCENIRNIDLGLEYVSKFKKEIDFEELKEKLIGSK